MVGAVAVTADVAAAAGGPVAAGWCVEGRADVGGRVGVDPVGGCETVIRRHAGAWVCTERWWINGPH